MDRDLGAKLCTAYEEVWFFNKNLWQPCSFNFVPKTLIALKITSFISPFDIVPLLTPSDGHHTLKVTICWSCPFMWWHLWFTTDSSKVSLLRRQSKVSSIISLLSQFSGNIWANKFLFLSISSVMSLISLARDWFCKKTKQSDNQTFWKAGKHHCNHFQFCSNVFFYVVNIHTLDKVMQLQYLC